MRKSFLIELEDYRGEHTAASNEGAPLFDLTKNGVYPEDVYSVNGLQYYSTGHEGNLDSEAFNIIRNFYNKPNKKIKIYRAVPYIKSKQEQLQDIADAKKLWLKRKKVHDNFIDLDIPEKNYYDYLYDLEIEVENSDEFIQNISTINSGDWITIAKKYAIDHGKSHLNNKYKVLSKTVLAKEIFTDGNSWLEWGYHPENK